MAVRMNAHRTDAKRGVKRHLYNWLRKVNIEPTVNVIEVINLTNCSLQEQRQIMSDAEQKWIAYFRALGCRLTNMTDGGDGAHGRVWSEESRQKMSMTHTGLKRSPEACANIKQAALDRPQSFYLRGEAHSHYGKPQTWDNPEARIANIKAAWQDETKRIEHGKTKQGEKNGNNKITAEMALAVYQDVRSYKEIAATNGLGNIKMVSDIKNGVTWRHVTGHDPNNCRTKYKINAEIAKEIYLAEGSHRHIAYRYGISHTQVSCIKSGKRWRQVTQLLNNISKG